MPIVPVGSFTIIPRPGSRGCGVDPDLHEDLSRSPDLKQMKGKGVICIRRRKPQMMEMQRHALSVPFCSEAVCEPANAESLSDGFVSSPTDALHPSLTRTPAR